MSPSPLLKWAGGKRWLVKHLEPYWRIHYHRTFVELFVGGMGAMLGLLPDKVLLNDTDYYLITLSAPRHISCNGNCQNALEVLAFKNIKP